MNTIAVAHGRVPAAARWWHVGLPRRHGGELRRPHWRRLGSLPVAAFGLVDPVHRARGRDAGGVAMDVGHVLVTKRAAHRAIIAQRRPIERCRRGSMRACARKAERAILLDHAPQARRVRAPLRLRLRHRVRSDGGDAPSSPTRSAATLLRPNALPNLYLQRTAPRLLLAPQGGLRLRAEVSGLVQPRNTCSRCHASAWLDGRRAASSGSTRACPARL